MITRKFLTDLNFSVMTSWERNGFAGCESPVPMLAEFGDYLVVLDGSRCEIYGDPHQDGSFEPIEICENVCELPY